MLPYVTAVLGSRTLAFLGVMALPLATRLRSLSPLLLLFGAPVRPEGEKVKVAACGESRLLPGVAARLVE